MFRIYSLQVFKQIIASETCASFIQYIFWSDNIYKESICKFKNLIWKIFWDVLYLLKMKIDQE